MNQSKTVFKYKILRPCLWFAKSEEIEVNKFLEYFTAKGCRTLLESGYIKVVTETKEL